MYRYWNGKLQNKMDSTDQTSMERSYEQMDIVAKTEMPGRTMGKQSDAKTEIAMRSGDNLYIDKRTDDIKLPGADSASQKVLRNMSGFPVDGFRGETAVEIGKDSELSLMDKLGILADSAKYDVACTSSGVARSGNGQNFGNTVAGGICHSFSSDGRCISLLKILMTNHCIYDCKYCVNRKSNDVPRAIFTPEEICELTMGFYKRNYIEGLFLSSGIVRNPDFTMELLYRTLYLLRHRYGFGGYIHVKAIPGANKELVDRVGFLADRMSINLELPTAEGLQKLAPNKVRKNILTPMRQIQNGIRDNRNEIVCYKHAPQFVPGGQSTQMIVGATGETDRQLLMVSEALYQKFDLKRVFYSAYVAINQDRELPALPGGPPLLREHRLYQADWLLRFYGFQADEILTEQKPNFNVFLDPKADWALSHLSVFPVEINRADYHQLLRVPGIGVKSAQRIIAARKHGSLDFTHLKKMGIVLKRALYFITCNGRMMYPTKLEENYITRQLLSDDKVPGVMQSDVTYQQLSFFDDISFQRQNGQVIDICDNQSDSLEQKQA